jgi:hypothetical protein
LARRGQAGSVAAALLLAVLGFSGGAASAAGGRSALDFAPADYTILSPDGATILGHTHYSIEALGNIDVLRGENRYLDGEYDRETDRLELSAPDAPPILAAYEHDYFDRNGFPTLVTRADLKAGAAECVRYENGRPTSVTGTFDFPSDTFAGASLLIPIVYRLRADSSRPIYLHAFSCVPDPRVLRVEAKPGESAKWPLHQGEALAVDVRPSFGWWDLLLEPLLPKLQAWFDPADRFSYLGGTIQRYYRGPWVELVRETNGRPGEAANGSSSGRRD